MILTRQNWSRFVASFSGICLETCRIKSIFQVAVFTSSVRVSAVNQNILIFTKIWWKRFLVLSWWILPNTSTMGDQTSRVRCAHERLLWFYFLLVLDPKMLIDGGFKLLFVHYSSDRFWQLIPIYHCARQERLFITVFRCLNGCKVVCCWWR